MPILVIDPSIVAFNGEQLASGNLALGPFVVTQSGIIHLKEPKNRIDIDFPKSKKRNRH